MNMLIDICFENPFLGLLIGIIPFQLLGFVLYYVLRADHRGAAKVTGIFTPAIIFAIVIVGMAFSTTQDTSGLTGAIMFVVLLMFVLPIGLLANIICSGVIFALVSKKQQPSHQAITS